MRKLLGLIITIFMGGSIFSSVALAAASGAKLVINGDEVIIYSGPSIRYRPLETATSGESFPVSLKRVPGVGGGEFYKVLVVAKDGKGRRVGYVNVADQVAIARSDGQEDVDAYQALRLAKDTVQFGFAVLKQQTYQWSVGYLLYPLPNFYVKGFIGQVLTTATGSFMSGVELGLDHYLSGPWSIYGSMNGGFLFPAQENVIYQGNNSTSPFVQGGFGLRYSAGEFAAASAGLIQSAYFNTGNSFLSTGGLITLEIGL